MEIYTWVEIKDGRIVTSSSAQLPEPPVSRSGGEIVLTDEYYPANTVRWIDGEVVYVGERANQWMEYDESTREWVDSRDLAFYKRSKWGQIKGLREDREFGPFQYNGMTFDGDLNSQKRIQAVAWQAQLNPELEMEWTLENNTEVLLTGVDFINLVAAKGAQVAAAFATARALRAAIDAAVDKEELDDIVWPIGV